MACVARNRQALFWANAPIAWVNKAVSTIAAGTNLEITAEFPISFEQGQNHIQRAPYVLLRWAHEPIDPATPVVVGLDDGATPPTVVAAGYPRPVAAGYAAEEIMMRPRDLSTSTTLLDGRRVWLMNLDPNNDIEVTRVWGVPLAGWS